MTVKVLTESQKKMVGIQYSNNRMTIKNMANNLGVSTRTIGRVLEELDLLAPQEKKHAVGYQVIQTLNHHGIDPKDFPSFMKSAMQSVISPDNLTLIMDVVTNLPESAYNSLIAQMVTLRQAKKHNTHVQSAMLNLQEKVERNVRDNTSSNG